MTYLKSDLAYCSNVHPGTSLAEVSQNLTTHFSAVRELRQLSEMNAGLWLSAEAVNELIASTEKLELFKRSLKENGVQLTSLNGFPFGNFHLDVVKEKVYLPTWAEQERLSYTRNLATILANCLPDDHQIGAISTLPFAYKNNWNDNKQALAINQLLQLTEFLKSLEAKTQKRIVICIEMEPDCVFEKTDELVSFFKDQLLPAANQANVNVNDVLRYIGCCYDTCHQGVMNENIVDSLAAIHQAGIYIGKIQLSNAISAKLSNQSEIAALTSLFKDQKFLHQTKVFKDGKQIAKLADLNAAELSAIQAEYHQFEARIHYHIPINQTAFEQSYLSSTQAAILTTLDFVKDTLDYQPFLEIETYTWLNLIRADQQQNFNLHQGILNEFTWLTNALNERSLLA